MLHENHFLPAHEKHIPNIRILHFKFLISRIMHAKKNKNNNNK